MIALVSFGLLAFANAAPYYRNHHYQHHYPQHSHYGEGTHSFWEELSKNLLSLNSIVHDLVKQFPRRVFNEEVDGDVYRITIPLSGFEEKDIVVQAKKGLAVIQAVHKLSEGGQRSHVVTSTLPAYVSEKGKWYLENDILKVEFPLTAHLVTLGTEVTTQKYHNTEEMESQNMGLQYGY